MAQIPVQKKSGFPWWAWLLIGLVALALLLWLLFALLGDEEEAAVAPEPTAAAVVAAPEPTEEPVPAVTPTVPAAAEQGTETTAGASGPITDLTTIFEEQDKASLAGRQVNLQGETAAQVQSVVGDTTFWVGPSQGQQVFVALSEEQDSRGVEGMVDVNEGQTVRLTGEVKELPSMEQARQQFGLSDTNSAQLDNQEIYIDADRVEIIER